MFPFEIEGARTLRVESRDGERVTGPLAGESSSSLIHTEAAVVFNSHPVCYRVPVDSLAARQIGHRIRRGIVGLFELARGQIELAIGQRKAKSAPEVDKVGFVFGFRRQVGNDDKFLCSFLPRPV